jgi:hypothetical protein
MQLPTGAVVEGALKRTEIHPFSVPRMPREKRIQHSYPLFALRKVELYIFQRGSSAFSDSNDFNVWKRLPRPLGRQEKNIFHMKCYKSWVHLISSLKNVATFDSFHERLIKLKKKSYGWQL